MGCSSSASSEKLTPSPEASRLPHPGSTWHMRTFSRFAEQMVRQAAGYEPVPWEAALDAFLDRVVGREIRWWLTGSAALAVRGLAITPRDLDLVVDDAGAGQLGELLVDPGDRLDVPVVGSSVPACPDRMGRRREAPGRRTRRDALRSRGGPPARGSSVEGSNLAPAAPGPPTTQLRTQGFARRTGEPDQDAHRAVATHRGCQERLRTTGGQLLCRLQVAPVEHLMVE